LNNRKSLNIVNSERAPILTVLLLAWPIFVEQILTTLVGYADTAMVGSLGAVATASVSISNSVVMFVQGAVMAMGVGITAFLSRAIGADDIETAKKLIRHTVMLLVCIGIPVGLLLMSLSHAIPKWMGAEPDVLVGATQYNFIVSFGRIFQIFSLLVFAVFRGAGDTKTPLVINFGVNILNVIGNFFLIYPTRTTEIFGKSVIIHGAGLAVNGAALATAISMAVGGIAAVLLLYMRESPLRISIHEDYHIDKELAKQVFKVSLPAIAERLCMSGAQIVISSSIASLGTVTVAANSVYLTAESMAYMPGFAYASAVTTLVGQSLGAKKPELARKFTNTCVWAAIITMTFAGAGLFFFSKFLVSIFTPDLAVIALASQCLRIVAFLEPAQNAAQVYCGALRGAGDTLWVLIITLAGMWGIRAVGAVVCIRILGLGLPYACTCMLIESFVRFALAGLRFKSGHWKDAIKNIGEEQTAE